MVKTSVAMCTYNGERYIKKQLESILKQTVIPDEIIICDDGSKDKTISIIENININSKVKIKVFSNKKSLGVIENFKKAYSKCKGDIIFSCDQDDIWEKNKVKTIVSKFESDNSINLIATNASLIDGSGKSLEATLVDYLDIDYENINREVYRKFCITGATMAFRKIFYESNPIETKLWFHDGYLAMIASLSNSIFFINECLTKYRLHDSNACGISKYNKLKYFNDRVTHPLYSTKIFKAKYNLYNEILNNYNTEDSSILCENVLCLENCVDFWKFRTEITNMSFVNCFDKVKKYKKVKYYNKYTIDGSGYITDLSLWIASKLFKDKFTNI